MRIFIIDNIALNVDNDTDALTLIEQGARELSAEEIEAAGMVGYEHLVGPTNTEIKPDGSIVFTPSESSDSAFKYLVAAKRNEIWGAGDAILAKVKANYTEAEIESWSKQEQGAEDIKSGNTETEAALFVIAIAQNRGIETNILVEKILNNVKNYGALSSKVIGEQQRLDDLIKQAEIDNDIDKLNAIVWTYNPFEENK